MLERVSYPARLRQEECSTCIVNINNKVASDQFSLNWNIILTDSNVDGITT